MADLGAFRKFVSPEGAAPDATPLNILRFSAKNEG